MAYEFGGFSLDAERRTLSLRGAELPLQPKAFDLLLYLVEHRDRVVRKDELLDAVWPGVVVSDGSLKRAVNLVRTALREGGAEDAIRTFQRQGYRFCGEVERLAADELQALPAEISELEQEGLAAQRNGSAREAIGPLQQAVAMYAAQKDRLGAARCAFHLAQLHFERRELTVGRGWLHRGTSHLPETVEAAEHGHRAWLASRFAAAEGDIDEALREAERACAIGRRLGDANLEALGLLYKGLALVARGEVQRGCAHHDEAAAAVLAEGVSPWVGGLVYCGLIFTCRNRADWRRAAEWTARFTELCGEAGLRAFPGTCRLHRAEVLHIRGDLAEAEREAAHVCRELAETAPWAEGNAFAVLGDLHLDRGAFDEAEAAYRTAHELGWDPQPGLARLHVARGNAEAGLRSLERSLAEENWNTLQRRGMLLAERVHVALAARAVEVARQSIEELDRRPELWQTPALRAMVAEARAALSLAGGEATSAVLALRQAVRLYHDVESPQNVARARLRLAEALLAEADPHAAELEIEAAARILDEVETPPLRAELDRVRARATSGG